MSDADTSSGSSRGLLAKVTTVASGHAIGYALAWAAAPLLSRLYDPDVFGVFAVFVICVSCASTVISFRYDQAIPLEQEPASAGTLAWLALVLSCGLGLVLLVAAPVVGRWTLPILPITLPDGFAALVVCGAVLLSAYQVVSGWIVRRQNYAALSRMRVAYAVSNLLCQILLPLMTGSIVHGLASGQVLGYGVGVLVGLASETKSWPKLPRTLLADARRVSLQYRHYPVCAVPSALLSALGVYAPALLLALLYGATPAGLCMLAMRLLATPMTLLSHSFSRVFYGEAVLQAASLPELRRLFRTTLCWVLLLAAPPVVIAAVIAPLVFGPFFGEAWREAGLFFSFLSPMMLLYLAAYAVSPALDVVRRQGLRLVREVLCVAAVAAGMLIAWSLGWSANGAVALTGGFGATAYLASIVLTGWALRSPAGEPLAVAAPEPLATAA